MFALSPAVSQNAVSPAVRHKAVRAREPVGAHKHVSDVKTPHGQVGWILVVVGDVGGCAKPWLFEGKRGWQVVWDECAVAELGSLQEFISVPSVSFVLVAERGLLGVSSSQVELLGQLFAGFRVMANRALTVWVFDQGVLLPTGQLLGLELSDAEVATKLRLLAVVLMETILPDALEHHLGRPLFLQLVSQSVFVLGRQ